MRSDNTEEQVSISKEQIINALKNVNDPELDKDIISLNFVEDIRISGNDVSFKLMLTTPACPLKDVFRKDCLEALKKAVPDIGKVDIAFGSRVRQDKRISEKLSVPVKNIIGISSGKGGVGKTTLTVRIAAELASMGAKVAILDADIYGPNIPRMLGISKPVEGSAGKIKPVIVDSMQIMSMGFLIPPDQALVWRGPMLHSALGQLLTEVEWEEADYLFIDMPPGTGDVQLSIAQLTPISGGIIVTTPHPMAVDDALRGIDAFAKLSVPLLGIIENMSGSVFGTGGAEELAKSRNLPFLGSVPLESQIAAGGTAPGGEGSPGTDAIREIAQKVASSISVRNFAEKEE